MYIDLRPDAPAPDPESNPRHAGDAAPEAEPIRPSPRDPADDDRPSLRTLRIFRVLMDD